MPTKRLEWSIRGNCVEGCTSPPVCPVYWGSPVQSQFHDGHSQCEGVRTFHIVEGRYFDVNLAGLLVSYGFCSPSPFPPPKRISWQAIFYLDEKANARQTEALEKIFRLCWTGIGGELLAVKRAGITFEKELVTGGPAAKYQVCIEGVYRFAADPLMASNGKPRYILSPGGGRINIGISGLNEFNDPDLPRGKWNAPNMSSTYFDFILNQNRLYWIPGRIGR
jgi:hypothetical protein